jgi:septum formation protein
MLAAAGLSAETVAPNLDEQPIKITARASGQSPGTTAERLAIAKAEAVTDRYPGAFVIGADQILECESRWFDKPADLPAAKAQLQALRGRSHRLWTAAVVVCDGAVRWRLVDFAELTMRSFSDEFLDAYLAQTGDRVLTSVGCYQVESFGIQLFDRIDGNHFTILGLPLLPLMAYLRAEGAVLK